MLGQREQGRSDTSRLADKSGCSVSTAVVFEIARARGIEPEAVEPLNTVVDPDALDSLFTPRLDGQDRAAKGELTFTLSGCTVTVTAEGISVDTPTTS